MKTIGQTTHRLFQNCLCLGLLLALLGCDLGKEDAYDPQPCDELCGDIDFTTFPNCDLTCGVDAADDVEVGFLARVFGIDLGASASSDEVATCELAVSNCDLSECQIMYGLCLNEASPDECLDVYVACLQADDEPDCDDAHMTCIRGADDERNFCYATAVTMDDILICDVYHHEATVLCDCERSFCLGEEPVDECLEDEGSRVRPVRVGPTRWLVPRELIDLSFGNLRGLSEDAGVTRWRRAGGRDYEGLKLWLVEKGDLFHAIGLRRDDVLLGVNGIPLRGENLGLEVLAPLYSADTLELRVRRGERTVSLQYELTDGLPE